MDTDDGFLSAVLANPADETLRLVYADWLDERDDPRGQFLRTQGRWNGDWGPDEDTDVLRSRLDDLYAVIDPGWRALMNTFGVKSKPVSLWSQSSESPFTEPLVVRGTRGRYGQPGGLITFASQFQLKTPPSDGLTADIRVLDDFRLELGECYWGRSDYTIYPFMAEFDTIDTTVPAILAALKTRELRGAGPGVWHEDFITNDPSRQYFFRVGEEPGDEEQGLHGVLRRYVSPAPLWYVLLHDGGGPDPRDAVHIGVGRSPDGNRLLGVIAGGSWG